MIEGWSGTGQYVQIPGRVDRIPEYDKRSGHHLFTIVAMFRWSPGTETPTLDTENLLTVQGPGCYYCEQIYTPLLAKRRCPGEPREDHR